MMFRWEPEGSYCILANCPYLIGTVPIMTQEKGWKKGYLTMCPYFWQKSVYSNVLEIQECPYLKKKNPPICPYFLGFRVGKYAIAVQSS